MSRKPRALSFLIEPSRYRHDPAVLAMSDAARGCYSMLFMAGWDLPEPGVYPADDAVLSQLAMTTPERWSQVRDEVARAFDVATRPGCWIQRGLVRTKAAQDKFVRHQSDAGKKGAAKRWGNDSPIDDPNGTAMATANSDPITTGGYGPSGSVLGSRFSGSENLQPFPPQPPSRARARPGPKPIDDALVAKLEAEYPRVDVRAVAAKIAEDFSGVRNPRSTLKNCVRIADERGFDLKRRRLTFGEDELS